MNVSIRKLSHKTPSSLLLFAFQKFFFFIFSLKNDLLFDTLLLQVLVKTCLVHIFLENKSSIYLVKNEISIPLITGFPILLHGGKAQFINTCIQCKLVNFLIFHVFWHLWKRLFCFILVHHKSLHWKSTRPIFPLCPHNGWLYRQAPRLWQPGRAAHCPET